MIKASSYYAIFLIVHSLFLGNLFLRDYLLSEGINLLHNISVLFMWVGVIFLLFRWDYILPIHKLTRMYNIESGRLIMPKSKLNYFFYRVGVWGGTIVAPTALIIAGLELHSILVVYLVLTTYLLLYLNRKALFDNYEKYTSFNSF